MRKIVIFLISATLFSICINLSAQNPNCDWEENPDGMLRRSIENIFLSNKNSCGFRFVMMNPYGFGWFTGSGIEMIVDGVSYGTVIGIPWGMGNYFKEDTVFLPSGEVQFFWRGSYSPPAMCFRIYNPSNELIYENPELLNGDLLLTYQNECPECLPLTNFEGEYNQEAKVVNLSWIAPESEVVTGFDVFRNGEWIDHVDSTINSYSSQTDTLETGDYTYCVAPVYPYICDLEKKCFETYINNVGIKNFSFDLQLYPNPARNELRVTSYKLQVTNVEVIDIYGRKQKSRKAEKRNSEGEMVMDISNLANGIYFVEITTEKGVITKKMIRQ